MRLPPGEALKLCLPAINARAEAKECNRTALAIEISMADFWRFDTLHRTFTLPCTAKLLYPLGHPKIAIDIYIPNQSLPKGYGIYISIRPRM